MTDPRIFNKTRRRRHRLHHDVGTKALDLEPPLRMEVAKPVECGGGQEKDRRTIEKRPRWERKIGDGVPVVEAFHIEPVLFGLRHRTARGCSKRDLTFESLRQRLVAIALFTSNDAAIRQRNPHRRYLRGVS